MLAPKKGTGWDITVDPLGYAINNQAMRILVTQGKTKAILEQLAVDFPTTRRTATASKVRV